MSSDDATTKPTIETVLERINEFRSEVLTQLKEVDSNIRMMNRKFDVLSKDILDMKADIRDAQYRLDKFEQKPS